MKLEPLKNWVIGRVAIAKPEAMTRIQLPNAPKGVTRCYLIDAVGSEAAAAGFAPGDMVVAKSVFDLLLLGPHRVTFPVDEAIIKVAHFSLDEFVGIDGKPLKEKGAAA
jgi:hypothetical protein